MANWPLNARSTNYNTYDLKPTGVAADDTAAWISLIAAINANVPAGKSCRIRVRDNGQSFKLSTSVDPAGSQWLLRGCHIYGETNNARIEFTGGYQINWGGYTNPTDMSATMPSYVTRGTMSAMPARTSRALAPNISLSRGDWVLLWSTDDLTDVAPHISGGSQRAAELHRVEYATGSDYVLDGFVVDALTTNPRIAKIQMLPNCGFSNLTVGSTEVTVDDDNAPQNSFLSVQRCLGFRMEDVRTDETGSGAATFQMCADGLISNFSGTYQYNNARNYAVLFQVVNGMAYQDSIWHNSRHVATTGGMQKVGENIRYGTGRNIVVRNVDQHISGDAYSNAWGGFDFHAEGWGIEVDRCRCFGAMYHTLAGDEEACYGFSTRARNTRFTRCEMISNMSQTSPGGGTPWRTWYKNTDRGFRVMAHDCTIEDCLVDGVWQAVWVREEITSTSFKPDRTIVRNCTFKNVSGPVLYCIATGCDNIKFYDNYVQDCSGYYATGSPTLPGAMIVLTAGTGHQIRRNYLDRVNNDYTLWASSLTPSEIEFRENWCLGYTARFTSGTNKIGVRGDTGDPNSASETSGPSFQSTYSALNFTS